MKKSTKVCLYTSFQSFANEDELRFDVAKEWYSLVVWLISIDWVMTDKAIYNSQSSLALIYLLFIIKLFYLLMMKKRGHAKKGLWSSPAGEAE